MTRGMIVMLALLAAPLVAQEPGSARSAAALRDPLVARFLAREDPPLVSYRAARRLEARNERFDVHGWMEVVTELAPERGFSWQVVSEGGSSYVRNKVLRKALEGEADTIRRGDPAKAALVELNYTFANSSTGPGGDVPSGLARFAITPKRKDILLVDGNVWVAAADGDLLQVDGRLSKSPSFWARTVDVVRRYARVAGIRVPVEMTSIADVRMAGRSSFRMTYQYETINGLTVPAPTGQH